MASTERCASPNQKRRLSLDYTNRRQNTSYNSDSSSGDERYTETDALSDNETTGKKISKTPSPPTHVHGKKSKTDTPPALIRAAAPINWHKEAGQGDVIGTKVTTPATLLPQDDECNRQRNEVEDNSVDTREITKSHADVSGVFGGKRCFIGVVLVAFVSFLVLQQREPVPAPLKNDMQKIDIFQEQIAKVKTWFPNQRVELWRRSQIHLKRHLQTSQPTEPVSLILTAGLNAPKTLHCLATSMASAFSAAYNASILLIDGATTANQDSDNVKLDIDSKLQGAFERNIHAAIIHRFDELPPGSTLIFYRYCDHENAAYKTSFLIFTVLLEEEELPAKIGLSAVEEMVDDHLQRKFLSDGDPVSFDRLDRDKYGGLWSRISHLILPVAAEEMIEHQGCRMT